MIKKIFILVSFITILASCSIQKDSYSIMISRYNSFLKILPEETRVKFEKDSKEYGAMYSKWQADMHNWIKETLAREEKGTALVTNTYKPDQKEYTIGQLTNKFYERENPKSLMNDVYEHTKMLSKEIAKLEQDEKFKEKLDKIKKDEAIENFNSEETTFYFLWNYLIALDRPRRFQ